VENYIQFWKVSSVKSIIAARKEQIRRAQRVSANKVIGKNTASPTPSPAVASPALPSFAGDASVYGRYVHAETL
jgi:hypothetical protein